MILDYPGNHVRFKVLKYNPVKMLALIPIHNITSYVLLYVFNIIMMKISFLYLANVTLYCNVLKSDDFT